MKEILWVGDLHGSYEIVKKGKEILIYNIQGPMQERILKLHFFYEGKKEWSILETVNSGKDKNEVRTIGSGFEFVLRELESVLQSHKGLHKYLSELAALEQDLVERMEKITENLKK